MTGEALMKVNIFTGISAVWGMDLTHAELEIISNTQKGCVVFFSNWKGERSVM